MQRRKGEKEEGGREKEWKERDMGGRNGGFESIGTEEGRKTGMEGRKGAKKSEEGGGGGTKREGVKGDGTGGNLAEKTVRRLQRDRK